MACWQARCDAQSSSPSNGVKAVRSALAASRLHAFTCLPAYLPLRTKGFAGGRQVTCERSIRIGFLLDPFATYGRQAPCQRRVAYTRAIPAVGNPQGRQPARARHARERHRRPRKNPEHLPVPHASGGGEHREGLLAPPEHARTASAAGHARRGGRQPRTRRADQLVRHGANVSSHARFPGSRDSHAVPGAGLPVRTRRDELILRQPGGAQSRGGKLERLNHRQAEADSAQIAARNGLARRPGRRHVAGHPP